TPLIRRVDSRFVPAGHFEFIAARELLTHRRPNPPLAGSLAGLPRPAAKARAVVLERQPQPHGRHSRVRKGGPGGTRPLRSASAGGDAAGLVVDELQIDHLGRVALPLPELHDPRVAARPLGETRRDLGEELVHDVVRAQRRERLTTGVEVAALAERDNLLGERLDRLRLGLRRLDPAVLDQGARQVRVERLAMGGVPPELLAGPGVPHAGSSSPFSVRPCAASVSRTSSIDLRPKFGIAASSDSLFDVRSPIVSMPTRLRQLYERTPSSSSSIGKFSIP